MACPHHPKGPAWEDDCQEGAFRLQVAEPYFDKPDGRHGYSAGMQMCNCGLPIPRTGAGMALQVKPSIPRWMRPRE